MTQKRLVSPSVTRDVVTRHGFQFKKSLGQNFLIDGNILDKIVEAAELDENAGALEIGPGIGTLTQELCEEAKQVVAVEKDGRLLGVLRETLSEYGNVHIEHNDVLEADLHAIFAEHFSETSEVSVVANLPYYVTTPIVMKLLEERLPLRNIVVMVQREVADRMAAKPGGKEYGTLSIAVQYWTEPSIVTRVPESAFMPAPNVESTVIKLKVRKEPPVQVKDVNLFFHLVKASFAQRRKTLLNNLQSNLQPKREKDVILAALDRAGIDPTRRGETLSLEEYAKLADELVN
ncbi:16S rRNA (adenine(1518)-N(6)/adenine(1519)-N(6))-dimethyltransferase RsmA [Tumebacillus sp. ITR2]|uniref:Ribosomal RNA small subunit methyltransferase A n=1 Tax=Tumebacillus amylolyticus TaxID=2801339 RepID=A0ABS1JHA4_9BACL|nr:16S rRNA (adenine(1518)-N(6)/adenine(1519)-N(6))-dimethyltransferase RsmA [Tumebacillus amylolyticus]MBL0389068.1 16S rRNA (adenine(1518)-N(6)/adenine(1519)-N(6))-dimethyltransferase RsmA [Tumebacillus amylolyticus]